MTIVYGIPIELMYNRASNYALSLSLSLHKMLTLSVLQGFHSELQKWLNPELLLQFWGLILGYIHTKIQFAKLHMFSSEIYTSI